MVINFIVWDFLKYTGESTVNSNLLIVQECTGEHNYSVKGIHIFPVG